MKFKQREDGCIQHNDLIVGPSPSEDVLGYAYFQLKKHGLIERIWHVDPPNLHEYLTVLSLPGVEVIGCYRECLDSDVAVFLGAGLINNLRRAHNFSIAEIGFMFMPEESTIFEKLTLGRMMIQYVFDKFDIDSLTGTTPAPNREAVAYARRLGFALHGPVDNYTIWEGKPCGAWISQMSRVVA